MAGTFVSGNVFEAFKNYKRNSDVYDAGLVIASNDGVITVEGLPNVKSNELIRLSDGGYALALNLEEKTVGAIVLTGGQVSAGDAAYSTGKVVSVPVGENFLGRVINPLGESLDGGDEPIFETYRNVEVPAPEIMDRDKVSEPLYTGIKAIDSMIPIGKGQRELIIGNRQTGKTAIALDTILNQKGKNVICVYVAIGQKASTVAKVIKSLRDNGAMEYTIVVASTAGQSAPLQYLAPYTGTAMAEYFMYNGKDALVVYDDLSKHAVAYRTISLLLKRPSGREAYPGDIFYVHSRLLERSAKLSKKAGGGSLTALPIIETLGGDISSYIPTNVISITDGQIYLEDDLFHAGIRPAINVGLSVSRVGGAAQVGAMRKISGKTRLDLAHFREMVMFSRFGSDIDAATKAIIAKGERLTEVLKQPQYNPVDMVDTVVTLYAMMNNMLKNVEVKLVNKVMNEILEFVHKEHGAIVEEIRSTEKLTDETAEALGAAIEEYLIKTNKK